jgi:L,D-transpeptidase ErfK/SrfK
MRRIIKLKSLPSTLILMTLLTVLASLQGCTTMTRVQGEAPPVTRQLEEHTVRNEFFVARGDDVIGRLRSVRLERGDTLPDIARHFSLGLNGLSAANPGVDVWVPEVGKRITLPMSFILPDAPRKGIVINLATMRLFQYREYKTSLAVLTYPVGVGTEERPSPQGLMRVERKVSRPTWHVPASIARDHLKKGDPLPASVPPGPLNPLGEYALYLSAQSYLIHGTNKPASIGLRATNGCFRLYPEDVKRLYESTPVKSPVTIVHQPYLLGQSNGVMYLEVHASAEETDSAELDRIYRKLKALEKESGRPLDWSRVKKVLAEASGIPVPIHEIRPGSGKIPAEIQEVKHPAELNYRPVVPELKADAWSVLAADLRDETEAVRLAAIINHQGPHIPARVVPGKPGYQVVAGPFSDGREARDVVKRLKIDLELEGRLIEPARKR